MKTLAAASLFLFAMVLGVAGPAWATLHFDCDHVTVHISATVEVPPCFRHNAINESPAGCHRHRLSLGGNCDPERPLGTALVDCTFLAGNYTATLDLVQQGEGHVTGWGETIVPFSVDVSGEYEIGFDHDGGGSCGFASVQVNGPGGLVGGGSWPNADAGHKSFRVILLVGRVYEIAFRQEGQTDEECGEALDELSGFSFDYRGNPERACCDPMTGGCSVTTADACLGLGRDWHPEWATCSPNPCPEPMPGATLKLGDWIDPEPWHDWVSVMPGSVIPVQVDPGEVPVPIDSMQFYYSADNGASWEHFATDHDGTEPWLTAPGAKTDVVGDGWHAELGIPELFPSSTIQFKVQAYTEDVVYESRGSRDADGSPPYLAGLGVSDWEQTDRDTLGVGVTSGGTTITRIVAYRSRVGDVYTKGIPGIDEHLVSAVHCVPTAAAQCLKYFELHGDHQVTGGLDSTALVAALGTIMKTNLVLGTLPTKWATGLAAWTRNHGNGYTIRAYGYLTNGGTHLWIEDDWLLLRNELERSQDVMVGVIWEGGGGHALTLNSITNPALPSGRYLLGFKDPWNGGTSTGELDPATGELYNVTGAGGGGGGYLAYVVIACPREGAVNTGGPGLAVFDGLPAGGPPYTIPVPLEDPGLYAVHIVVVNSLGHACRTTRLVIKESTGGVPEQPGARPMVAQLSPPVPNPFRTIAQISYTVPARMAVSLTVFDVTGRKVRVLFEGELPPGSFRATWDGRDEQGRPAASGMYYVKLRTPGQEATQTVVLVR